MALTGIAHTSLAFTRIKKEGTADLLRTFLFVWPALQTTKTTSFLSSFDSSNAISPLCLVIPYGVLDKPSTTFTLLP